MKIPRKMTAFTYFLLVITLATTAMVYSSEQEKQNKNLLFSAYKNNQRMAIEALFKGASINCYNKNGKSPLMIAATYYGQDLIEFFLSHGANIEQRDISGSTALIIATIQKNFIAVKTLLKNGADKEATDKSNYTALDWACFYEFTKIMSLLGAPRQYVQEVKQKKHTKKCYRCQFLQQGPSKGPLLSPSFEPKPFPPNDWSAS